MTIGQFTTEDSIYCTQSDIVYSMTVSHSASFVNFDATNRVVSWSTSDCTVTARTYEITITGKVTNGVKTFKDDLQFELDVSKQSCTCSTEGFHVIAFGPSTITYMIGDA